LNGPDKDGIMSPSRTGREIYELIQELYPICRSITGNGFRQSMEILQRHLPLAIQEVPSGTKVFDWTVPKEWNIRDAYVKNAEGQRLIDFRKSNLHVVGHSVPIRQTMSLEELRPHLFTLPQHADWIPYKTSYYEENGDLDSGSLTYGELYLPGNEQEEILISCHACHPSLCNDNLSGVGIATMLAKQISLTAHRYSYRFLFIPGTIGAITWLARNEDKIPNIRHGLVLAGLGDSSKITYKRSRLGDADIDRAASHVLQNSGLAHQIVDFDPYGYDERQYCSPGFNLAMGCLSRAPSGTYPEYHTSADDLDFIKPDRLGESLCIVSEALHLLESNRTYMNMNPKCEPQLGKRGLYSSIGEAERALLWVLNLSDGSHDLLDIAEKAGMRFTSVQEAAARLVHSQLLRPLDIP